MKHLLFYLEIKKILNAKVITMETRLYLSKSTNRKVMKMMKLKELQNCWRFTKLQKYFSSLFICYLCG